MERGVVSMRNLWFKGVLLALAVAVAGCGQRVQVEIPPKAPVEGIRSIVVLPFDNVTNDAALGYEIEERIADVLRSSGWYESVQTVRHLVALPPGQPVTLASLLGLDVVAEADAAIVGTATYYFEDVYVDVPYCSGCGRTDVTPTWSVTQTTHVAVRFTARLIETATGRELYAVTAEGEDTDLYTHFSIHRGDNPPAEALVPKPNRQRVPATRSWAIDRAVRQFTRDLLPTYEWRAVE